jgi:hypothetical protein
LFLTLRENKLECLFLSSLQNQVYSKLPAKEPEKGSTLVGSDQPVQPSLIFQSEARAKSSGAPFRMGCEGSPGTNSLAYFGRSINNEGISFTTSSAGQSTSTRSTVSSSSSTPPTPNGSTKRPPSSPTSSPTKKFRCDGDRDIEPGRGSYLAPVFN